MEPFIFVDMKQFRCLTLKHSLAKFIQLGVDPLRVQMALMNRSLSRKLFMQNLKDIILMEKVNLREVSQLFMKISSIYYQATIERKNIRKAAGMKQGDASDVSQVDALILKQHRLTRLRANTSFNSSSINSILTEKAPTNRVLSGELIVFQNQMVDLLKEISEDPVMHWLFPSRS